MIKKFYIVGLIFSFLFSTTGLSITQHICQMMNEVSSEQCGMCTENEIPETSSCCKDENFAGEIITSGNFSECCNTQVVENKVEDQFSLSSNTKHITNIVAISVSPLILESEKDGSSFKQNNYSLPPPKFGKYLLQAIHQLKIDLPVC